MMLSIENLSSDASEQEVSRLFASYGKVLSIKLSLGSLHSKYPGHGIVEIEGDQAKSIVAVLDRCLFKGTILRVKEFSGLDPVAAPVDRSPQGSAPTVDDRNNRSHNTLRVVSVEQLGDSESGLSDEWCRYTIRSGASCITGLRRGSIAEVKQYAEDSIEAFNQRNMLKSGMSQAWSSRTRK